ncbi:MAG: hypothetical protein ACYTEP_01095 [Planctomycetota bacterium]|jgi:hypothetical protein
MISILPNLFLAASALTAVPAQTAGASPEVLVYDHGPTNNGFAREAALNLYPLATIADSGSFNTSLTSQAWDLVMVDCPSTIPSGGWGDLIDHVNDEGIAILSFGDWDSTFNTALLTAFEVSAPVTLNLSSQTLIDMGTSDIFAGVTMPVSDWSVRWVDDGDEFTLLPGAVGLAHVGDPAKPVMALGNSGRTIASFVLDEAGPTWIGDESGVHLWENMVNRVMNHEPIMEVTDIIPGRFMTISASNLGFGSDVVFLVSSLGAGPTSTPFGVVEVTLPWRQSPPFPADISGSFGFTSTLPPGASGSTFYMQSVVFMEDGSTALTNPLEIPIP